MKNKQEAQIDNVLNRGVEEILPSKDALRKLLLSGKKIKLYQGFDPTGTALHIGHMAGLRKLRQFQDLGHEVIFLIGDGTGQAGDPSGKLTARDRFLTQKELRKNAADYVRQASKIVRFEGTNAATILFNGDWLNKLKLVDVLNIAGHFSLQQLSERSLFQERMKRGESVNMREFLYPLLQGYDSVALGVDLEIGGSDQVFNMLAGRTLAKAMLQKEKFVLTIPLLTDSQGRKIGKTEGNVIGITDKPGDLFGKIMSLSDDVMFKAFEYLTDVPLEEIEKMKNNATENPVVFKRKLAYEVVIQLSDKKSAQRAEESFKTAFKEGGVPSDIQKINVKIGERFADSLVASKVLPSKSVWRRLVLEGAVTDITNDKKITAPDEVVYPCVLRIGKKIFIEIISV